MNNFPINDFYQMLDVLVNPMIFKAVFTLQPEEKKVCFYDYQNKPVHTLSLTHDGIAESRYITISAVRLRNLIHSTLNDLSDDSI